MPLYDHACLDFQKFFHGFFSQANEYSLTETYQK